MIQITATIIVLIVTTGITQRIISPQLSELQNLCPGDEVTFTCETRGSPVIAWSSDEYIGSNVQFEFFIVESVGTTHTSPANPNTVVTLINVTTENGVAILVSQLHIIVLSGFLTSSVTCIHLSLGQTNTIVFHVLGMFHLLMHGRIAY